MWPDLGKPTKSSHLVFQEKPFYIETTVVLLCYTVAMLDLQYNQISLLASVL